MGLQVDLLRHVGIGVAPKVVMLLADRNHQRRLVSILSVVQLRVVVTVDFTLQVSIDVMKDIHVPFTLDATFERQYEFIDNTFRYSIDFFA